MNYIYFQDCIVNMSYYVAFYYNWVEISFSQYTDSIFIEKKLWKEIQTFNLLLGFTRINLGMCATLTSLFSTHQRLIHIYIYFIYFLHQILACSEVTLNTDFLYWLLNNKILYKPWYKRIKQLFISSISFVASYLVE